MATKLQAANRRKAPGARENEELPNDGGTDPYLRWAIATNFAYLGGDSVEWYPVLLELDGISAAEFSSLELIDSHRILVPSIYATTSRDIARTTFCTALFTREALLGLRGNLRRRLQIARFELGVPVVPPFGRSPTAELQPLATNPPKAAIVAVIDDGIAFAHQRFRDSAGGTRFKYFWNQDDTTGIGAAKWYGWGRELRKREIDMLLTSCKFSGIVDEEQLYRRAGQTLAARRGKHGTHVMDIACGMDPGAVTDQSPYLIGVQLPHWVTQETSGATLTPMVYDALNYIVRCADEIAAEDKTAPLPIVVNLSYGAIAGPHDGTAPLEAAIDELIAARATPLRVVLPAGNHYLARCHAHFAMPAALPQRRPVQPLDWRVQPDNQSGSFVEIWLPQTQLPQPQVEVRVTTPGGESSPWLGPGGGWYWPSPADTRFLAHYIAALPDGRPHILLSMAPTAEVTTAPRTAPSGTWHIDVKNIGRAIEIDAWVQRGDTPPGYPLYGRQSRFDDWRYVRFDLSGRLEENDIGPSHIHRRGTLNSYASGSQAIVVGGHRLDDHSASRYSGSGPLCSPAVMAVPPRVGPDVTAVSDDSVAKHGVLAAGTRTGSICVMDGTSVAAPQVTQLIAKLMTPVQASDRAAVQRIAMLEDPLPKLPPERGGAGRIGARTRRSR